MTLTHFAKKVKRNLWPYEPSVEILISRKNLLHNLHQFQHAYPGLGFAPVLKSNAYGHGLSLVASTLDKEDIVFFVVDSLFEAKVLRNDGIASPILVIGFVTPENIAANSIRNVSFTITSLDQLTAIATLVRKKTAIHLKVDTGLSRQGIMPDEVEKAIEIIDQSPLLKLEGLCSHFAEAYNKNSALTKNQIKTWQTVVWQIKHEFPDLPYFHLAATAGADLSHTFESNTARLGIGLYGFNPAKSDQLDLKPVLSMRSVIGSVKKIPAGSLIGYGGTAKAKKDMTVATVPVGYYEGVDRRLSNNGSLQVNGIQCPIVGRVSMNITIIDVSAVKSVKLGDPVTIISNDPHDNNSVSHIADLCDTISHEILVHLPQSLRRTEVE